MGLRCSLLGHDYGEPFVERGREERGNEVVVTERELQECTRCGAENVTTENTEVRSIEPTSGGSTASGGTGASGSAGASGGANASGSASASSGDAAASSSGSASGDSFGGASTESSADASSESSGGAFTSASDAIERAEADTADDGRTADSATADADADAATDAADDGVIIDDSAADAAGSEQWDEQADVDPNADHEPTPEPDDEDVEFVDSSPSRESAGQDTTASGAPSASTEYSDAGTEPNQSGGAQAVATERSSDRPRGEWPEHDGEDVGVDATSGGSSFQFGDESEQVVEADTGFTSAGPLDQSGDDDLDFALYCPECGFDRHAAGSSLRAGDICPNCRKGYLAEDR